MSAHGTKRTLEWRRSISAFDGVADAKNLTKSNLAEQPNADASGAEANGNSRQNLGSVGLIF
jgi:hypothetical protein